MSVLRAIMVDLDGTLARTGDANSSAYVAALSEAGVAISRHQFESIARARNWREFLPEILAGVDADPSAIARRKTEIYLSLLDTVEINWPLVRLLEACRERMQMKTALVTTASSTNVSALLDLHGLTHQFDTVVNGDEVQRHKPDPSAYILAAERLDVQPSECLVYEDADEGVASATAFGAQVLRIRF